MIDITIAVFATFLISFILGILTVGLGLCLNVGKWSINVIHAGTITFIISGFTLIAFSIFEYYKVIQFV